MPYDFTISYPKATQQQFVYLSLDTSRSPQINNGSTTAKIDFAQNKRGRQAYQKVMQEIQ